MAMHEEWGRPDEGWSWVVVFAACFCSLVLAGIFRTSGVLFVAFIDAFAVTREEAAWPMGICIAVLNLTGPFSGILGHRYGVRPVVIAGAVVGAIGVSACYFTTSLALISVLFGGIFGIGYGLVNTLMPVIVNVYFLNLRGTANGIANSGSCLGSVILPVLFEFLIAKYGLSGCFLLTGGVVLNVAVAGALMRPPSWLLGPNKGTSSKELAVEEGSVNLLTPKKKTSMTRNIIEVVPKCSVEEEGGFAPPDPGSEPQRHLQAELASALSKRTMLQASELSNFVEEASYESLDTSNSSVFDKKGSNPDCIQIELARALSKRTMAFQASELSNFAEESYESLDTSNSSVFEKKGLNPDCIQIELRRAEKEFEDTLSDFQSVAAGIVETSKSEEILNRIKPDDEDKTSQLTDNCPARHSFSVSSAKRVGSSRFKSQIPSSGPLKKYSFKLRNSSGDSDLHPVSESQDLGKERPDASPELVNDDVTAANFQVRAANDDFRDANNDDVAAAKSRPETMVKSSVRESFRKVLTSAMFYVTAVTNVTFYFIFHMYVVIVVDYSLDQGVAESDTKYVLFAFSLSDLFGRLCLGWVTDREILGRARFAMTGMVGIGLVFFAFPFATDYYGLVVVSCCYGVLLGCTMVVFPILLVDYLGTEVHAVAYGCMCFMNGFTSLVRPLIIGYFRDKVGSYHNMFYILGSISIIASSLWVLEKCFHPRPQSQYEPMKEKPEVT